ncbi:DUF5602 domain-containing protein [Bdellovibrio reynosensis]|uniref:TTHB210-like domain-containing protein n=1 Tax=Bdellovibrio reynosensis TaxID=2835041 RepID=A0ABY4CBP4_9BACT|nr:hypothetical protein [Bdellovibrio reynosensis]UOF01096.1 hypothetical protein MNR06_15450 [Bdellovibrio reynosensis]
MKEFVLFLCLLFAGFNAQAFIINGEEKSIGNGSAWAFADITSDGFPKAIGMAFTEGALQGLPPDMFILELFLPSVLNIPPYSHMNIDWNPHGHEPDGVYNVPHFDFHFFFIPPEVQKAITCMGDDRAVCLTQPSPEEIPPFYVPTPEGVPGMGWHWVDSRSPELNGGKFTSTMIYGFYAGDMNFVEPMITRDFFLSKKSHHANIPTPLHYAKNGIYPTSYSVTFNSIEKVYYVTMKNTESK